MDILKVGMGAEIHTCDCGYRIEDVKYCPKCSDLVHEEVNEKDISYRKHFKLEFTQDEEGFAHAHTRQLHEQED